MCPGGSANRTWTRSPGLKRGTLVLIGCANALAPDGSTDGVRQDLPVGQVVGRTVDRAHARPTAIVVLAWWHLPHPRPLSQGERGVGTAAPPPRRGYVLSRASRAPRGLG